MISNEPRQIEANTTGRTYNRIIGMLSFTVRANRFEWKYGKAIMGDDLTERIRVAANIRLQRRSWRIERTPEHDILIAPTVHTVHVRQPYMKIQRVTVLAFVDIYDVHGATDIEREQLRLKLLESPPAATVTFSG